MYTASKNCSARLSDAQSTELTHAFNKLSEITGKEVTSFKQGLLVCIEYINGVQQLHADECNDNASALPVHTDAYLQDAIKFTPKAFANIKEAFGSLFPEIEISETEMDLESFGKVSETIFPPLSIQEQLNPGQVVFQMTENEYKVFKQIQENRAKRLAEHDVDPETDAQLTKAMIFNEAVLYEWAGQPYTGLSL